MIDGNVSQDALSCLNLCIVSLLLCKQEICSLICCSLKAFVAREESFIVLLFVVIDSQSCPLVQVPGLLLSQVKLIVDFLAMREKLFIADLLELLVNVALSLKLVHALFTNLLNCSICGFLLTLCFPLDRMKRFLGLESRPVEVFFSLFLLALCDLHGASQLEEALPC